jgi:hypothetical protein
MKPMRQNIWKVSAISFIRINAKYSPVSKSALPTNFLVGAAFNNTLYINVKLN